MTAFLFVSDDMEWAKNSEILREEKNLFFEGISFMNHPLRSDLACQIWGIFQCPKITFALLNLGCGNGADWSCVGRDLAILAACNHTILTRGSFGQWAAYLSGGDAYTEYGPMTSRKC